MFIFCLYNLISETTIKVSCWWLYLLLTLTVLIFLFVQTVYCWHTEWIRLSDTGPQCLLHQGRTLSFRARPCKLNYSSPGHMCYYLWTLIKQCYFCTCDWLEHVITHTMESLQYFCVEVQCLLILLLMKLHTHSLVISISIYKKLFFIPKQLPNE